MPVHSHLGVEKGEPFAVHAIEVDPICIQAIDVIADVTQLQITVGQPVSVKHGYFNFDEGHVVGLVPIGFVVSVIHRVQPLQWVDSHPWQGAIMVTNEALPGVTHHGFPIAQLFAQADVRSHR